MSAIRSKWVVIIAYAAITVLLVYHQDAIIAWIQGGESDRLVLIFAAAVGLGLVPAVPFGLVSGMFGMKYGALAGGILSVASSTTAAIIFFILVRLLFQRPTRAWLSKFKRLEHFTGLFDKNAFMAVLIARLIPIIPAQAVNGYAAVSSMRLGSYVLATVLGKIPVMFVFAWIGDQLFADWRTTLAVIGIYAAFVIGVYGGYRAYRKRV